MLFGIGFLRLRFAMRMAVGVLLAAFSFAEGERKLDYVLFNSGGGL